MARLIEIRTTSGAPLSAGELRVTPLARVVVVRLPFGAFVWQRPRAVLVERGPNVERLPIVDVTPLAQLGLCAATLVVFAASRRWPAHRKEH